MSKCILLIRVSTGVQDLDQQSQAVKNEALKCGYYEDSIIPIKDIESGSKLSEEERHGLNKLKSLIIDDEDIDCVFCYELSRISRQTKIVYSIRDFLVSHKVNLICCNPYFRLLKEDGTLSDTASIVFGIFASLAEQETYIRVQRITRGKEKKTKEGKLSVGKPLFGYTIDSEHYPIPHPKEAPIVVEIFDRYVNKRESSGAIAKDLYLRKAFRDDSLKLLTIQNYISVVLREPRYCGGSIYPALVSKELYSKAESIRKTSGCKFTRKSRTKQVYPLQGYLFTTDGYRLTIGVTNNRYLKMNDASIQRISLRMDAADNLTRIVLKRYIESGAAIEDLEAKRLELSHSLSTIDLKLKSIELKLKGLESENDMINTRIVKGRLSEKKGDEMIDSNLKQMMMLEDTRQDLKIQYLEIENQLLVLANPLLSQEETFDDFSTNEKLRLGVEKYIKKVIVEKVKFSTYRLEYHFTDSTISIYHFYSINRGVTFYDSEWKPIVP